VEGAAWLDRYLQRRRHIRERGQRQATAERDLEAGQGQRLHQPAAADVA
jgi:hypothetical protein